jgi:RNA polymerase sigma-70 factor (ECF subfamily)
MMSLQHSKAAPSRPQPENRKQDQALAAAAAAGDRPSQRKIAQMIYSRVRNIVAYTVNNPAVADDVTQSAMLKILCSLQDYRGDSSIEFWSVRIAVRMAMRAVKTMRRRQYLLFFLPEPRSPFEETHGPAENADLRLRINALVSKLPEKQQIAIRLRYVHEYSIEEIAAILSVSENTVRDRLRVGKKRLKSLLQKNPAVSAWMEKGRP